MKYEHIFSLIIAGFGLGILLRSFWVGIPALAQFFIFLGAFFALLYFFRRSDRRNSAVGPLPRQTRPLVFMGLAIFLLAFGFGMLRYNLKDAKSISDDLRSLIGQEVLLKGIIADEPDERENNTRLVLKTDNFYDMRHDAWHKIDEGNKILIFAGRYPEFAYGDLVEVRGELQEVEDFTEEFSWRAYLAKDDIFLQIFYPKIIKIESGHGSALKRALFSIKQKYLESLSGVLPEPHASFMGGLTVGARRAMPDYLLDDFRKVGLIHIVVLSGYNVTIVARSVALVFGAFFPWALSIVFGLVGILFFAILTGASATVVRASIMAALVYLAQATGRVYQVSLALFVAGFLMLLHNPKILRFDASFQLSFVATLGLILLAPRLERFFKWLPEKYQIREHILATTSAQIAVAPLILYMMGSFSFVAVPANALVLVLVPLTMFFGLAIGLLAYISNFLATPFAWVGYGLLAYQLKITEFFAGIPFVRLSSIKMPAIGVLFIYIFLLWLIFSKKSPLGSETSK